MLKKNWPHLSFQEKVSKDHLEIKIKELSCLLSFTDNFSISEPPETYEDLFRLKLGLRDAIRAKSAKNLNISESRLSANIVKLGGLKFKYVYQRMKIDLVDSNPLNSIYQSLQTPSHLHSHGLFTSSCQVAIATLFHALSSMHSNLKVLLLEDTYWETQGFFKKFNFSLEFLHDIKKIKSNSFNVLYLDSSSEHLLLASFLEEKISLLHCQLIAVDTTCYPQNSLTLKSILELAQKYAIPCVFLRSHMKLDCIGMEYGRLGSIVFTWNTDISSKKNKYIQSLISSFSEIASYHTTFANLSQIYPFYSSLKFQKYNLSWCNRIEDNNRAVVSHLMNIGANKDELFSIKSFAHNKYFWVITNKQISDSQAVSLCKTLDRSLSFLRIPHLSMASYPWDFLSITPFKKFQILRSDQNNKTVIRISVADLDREKIEHIKQALAFWLLQARSILK